MAASEVSVGGDGGRVDEIGTDRKGLIGGRIVQCNGANIAPMPVELDLVAGSTCPTELQEARRGRRWYTSTVALAT